MAVNRIATTMLFCLVLGHWGLVANGQDKKSAVESTTRASTVADQWWSKSVEAALESAGDNRKQLQTALTAVPESQRPAMAFLIENMPAKDLKSLTSEFLLEHVNLAYQSREKAPWGKTIPDEIFLNDVVAYANVNEKREAWRADLFEKSWPIVKDCKTPAEAAQKLNEQLFKLVKVRYSTKRRRPDQAPSESIEQGMASCTGLSILLSDACRSVCVPARLAGTPLWTNKRGNHTWVEIWDGKWHFTGACEPSNQGLNHGWFVNDAAKGQKDSKQHAIYASSFRKTEIHFPLVWARRDRSVPAVNVTERYNALVKPKKSVHRLMVRVVSADKKTRVAQSIKLTQLDSNKTWTGTSKDESADTNDFLTFEVEKQKEYRIDLVEKTSGKLLASEKIKSGDRPQSITTLSMPAK